MNNQSSAVDIPTTKTTRIVATTTQDGHVMLSSIATDQEGNRIRRNSLCADTGISPTYYTSTGSIVQTSRQGNDHQLAGSPVYDDKSRIFFSHNSGCSCKFFISCMCVCVSK